MYFKMFGGKLNLAQNVLKARYKQSMITLRLYKLQWHCGRLTEVCTLLFGTSAKCHTCDMYYSGTLPCGHP